MKALMILTCPNCQGTVTGGGTLTHSGLCPQPEIRQYLIPVLPLEPGL